MESNQVEEKKKWWHASYILDWILGIVTLVLAATVPMAFEPNQRYFQQNDPSINYPSLKDIFPFWAAGILAVVTPVALFAVFFAIQRSFHDFHHGCLGLLEAMALCTLATEPTKVAAGRLRPFFLNNPKRDAHLSFPSGHSSTIFTGMCFCALYLSGKLGTFRKGDGAFWKMLLNCLFFGTAMTVAVSRTVDYHHNFDDILAGSFIGICASFFGYLLNFHSITSKVCHLPRFRQRLSVLSYNLDPTPL